MNAVSLWMPALLSFQLHTGIPHQKIFLASQLTDWRTGEIEFSETSPGDYSLNLSEPWLHQLQYKFVVDGSWLTDPVETQRTADGFGGFNSVREISFNEDPNLVLKSGVAPPKMWQWSLPDYENEARLITVVEPESHATQKVILYFQDGDDYLASAFAANVLANLSAEAGMPQLIGIFIPAKNRTTEYSLTSTSDAYVDFVVNQVVPQTELKLGLQSRAKQRLLVGDSLGGLISLYTALLHPDVFPQVASQSGAFGHQNQRVLEMLRVSPVGALQIYLSVGLYDLPGFLEITRKAKSLAEERHSLVSYDEVPGIHDWITWRNELSRIFRRAFGRSVSPRSRRP